MRQRITKEDWEAEMVKYEEQGLGAGLKEQATPDLMVNVKKEYEYVLGLLKEWYFTAQKIALPVNTPDEVFEASWKVFCITNEIKTYDV